MSSLRQRRLADAPGSGNDNSAAGPARPEPAAADDPGHADDVAKEADEKIQTPLPTVSLMPLVWRALVLLLFVAATQITGVLLFTKGFLLTRTELTGSAYCSQPPASTNYIDESKTLIDTTLSNLVSAGQATPSNWSAVLAQHGECTLPPRFNRSLLFIVDALRYDFVSPARPSPLSSQADRVEQAEQVEVAAHHQLAGSVPVVQALQAAQPDSSFLAHFAADPPTTTLQRIKALMNGVLPTFVDAGSNFGATEIGEDNLLSQLRARAQVRSQAQANSSFGSRDSDRNESSNTSGAATPDRAGMAFMGDDTWLSLFPDVFDKEWTWPYDSFHVEDLDTVDRGVQSHIRAFLDPTATTERTTEKNSTWTLLLAHQLGLDHAGHRYGPGHTEFGRKLQELDGQVRFMVDHLPDDALFVLMGDHGMDAKGDHGGDGQLETGAAFFAYSQKPLTAPLPEGEQALRYSTLPSTKDTRLSFGDVGSGIHFGPGQYVATPDNLTAVGGDYFVFVACAQGARCKIQATDQGAHFSGPCQDSYVLTTARDDLASDELSLPHSLRRGGTDASSIRTTLGAPDEYIAFPPLGDDVTHRSIQQIDFVPSFALLQGLPIPFNSLGTVVPELFAGVLLRALRINALQIHTYIRRYIGQAGDFNPFVRELDYAWTRAARADWVRAALPAHSPLQGPLTRTAEQAYFAYTRLALTRAKEVWAKFDLVAMGAGLALLVLGTLSALRLRSSIGSKPRPGAGLRAAVRVLSHAAGLGFIVAGPAIALVLGIMGLYSEVSVLELFPAVRTRNVLGLLLTIQLFLGNLILLLGGMSKTFRALLPRSGTLLPLSLVLLHAASLGSNSFIVWEDHVTSTLLQVLLLLCLAAGARLRFGSLFSGSAVERAVAQRDLLRSGALAVLGIIFSRVLHSIRVCREEQAPYCQTTFYARLVAIPPGDSAGSMNRTAVAATALGSSTNSLLASALSLFVAWWLVPTMVRLTAGLTRSDTRLVQLYVKWLIRSTMVAGVLYWVLDTLSAGATGLRPSTGALWANALKRPLAILLLCASLASILVVWPGSPLPLELKIERAPVRPKQQQMRATGQEAVLETAPAQWAVLSGVTNVLAMHYLFLVLFVTSFVFLFAQPMGQVALGMVICVVLCLAEVSGGGKGDVSSANVPASLRTEHQGGKIEVASPLVLVTLNILSHVAFFSTGHQASVSSIQWRAAFVGFNRLVYPFAPVFVTVNTLGPSMLAVLALPLVVLWRHAPRPRSTLDSPTHNSSGSPLSSSSSSSKLSSLSSPKKKSNSTMEEEDNPMPTIPFLARAALGYVSAASIVCISATVFATVMRRHLMLFKVWAPRFMLSGLMLGCTHVLLLLGIAAAALVCHYSVQVLGTQYDARHYAEFEDEED